MQIDTLCILIIQFFVFACLGWAMEVTLKFIQYHRFINRGFLIGPYCPIYGTGVVIVTVIVGGLIGREGTLGETFLAGFFLCGALEYFSSWYMEKLFHARWWDYSQKPMNLNGRIWIGNLMLFGLASVVIVKFLDPLFFALLGTWPPRLLRTLAVCIVVLFLADEVASHVLMNLVRRQIDAQQGDNTEEISRQVHALLRNRGLLVRRIHEAYPKLQARPLAMTKRLQEAGREFRAAKRRLAQMLREAAGREKDPRWEEKLQAAKDARRAAGRRLHELQKKLRFRDEGEE